MSPGQQACARGCPGPVHHDPTLNLPLCVPCHVREHLHARRIDLVVPRAIAAQVVVGADRAVRRVAATITDLRCHGQWLDLHVVQLQNLHAIAKVARCQEKTGGPLTLTASWRTLATILTEALDWQVATAREHVADSTPGDPDAVERAIAETQVAEAINHLFFRVRSQRRLTLPHETEVHHVR